MSLDRSAARKRLAASLTKQVEVEPQWVEVDLKRVRVECARQFGGVWLGYELLQRLGLIQLLAEQLAIGREDIPWA
ncbi:MAG: hypothetical protein WB660_10580, partial [Candidatus Sulfotelmatobacter sp.]